MATNGPEANLESKQPTTHADKSNVRIDTSIEEGNFPETTTTANGQSPVPPLRPPRAHHANLVQPKHELQPPPTNNAVAGKSTGAAAAVGGGVVGVRKSTCEKCTNVSIMQIFYEMKQRFPTVSDDVVSESVLDHCHQRQKLLDVLQAHSESNQTLIPQSYPSKALRGSTDNILGGSMRKKNSLQEEHITGDKFRQNNTIPRRGKGSVGAALAAAAVPLVGMVSGERNALNGSRRQSDTNNPNNQGSSDMLSNGGSFLSNNIQRMAISGAGGGAGGAPAGNKVERPCTLNLSPAPNRPFRTAPPIPSTTSSTSSLSSLSTATDLQSASSPQLTASNESINVSVNVTLSPIMPNRSVAGHVSKPPIPPRHTTELTVQPEILPFPPPVVNTTSAMPTRSFTSVNFTLRQPTVAGAGGGSAEGGGAAGAGGDGASAAGFPIDITTAGSSMTYSSSSYNAKAGYQSQLQITVGNGGGSISAIRTKAPVVTSNVAAGGSSNLMRSSGNAALGSRSSGLDADVEEVLINRQLQSKWKLKTELDKYRKRMDVMQRDIKVLETPLSASVPEQLQEEIMRLQTVCDRMAAAVEEAGNFALGEINEAFYQRLDSQSGGSTDSPTTPRSSNAAPVHPLPNSVASSQSASIPGSPAVGRASVGQVAPNTSSTVTGAAVEEDEPEGWTCSQCTFQNHPELNMCEQCGMVKRQQPRPQPQQQQQQSPGIVQITSTQFIPALAANQNHPSANVVRPPLNNMNMSPYMMPGYLPSNQPSPRIIYGTPMSQYPPTFAYPSPLVTPSPHCGSIPAPGSSPAVALGHIHTPPPGQPQPSGSGGSTRSKGKKGSKFSNSKFSQSISNLFSSSSSSSSTTAQNSSSRTNSQE